MRDGRATRAGRLHWYHNSPYIPTSYTSQPVSAHCMRKAYNYGDYGWPRPEEQTGYPRNFEDPYPRQVWINEFDRAVSTFEVIVSVDTSLATASVDTATASEVTLFQNANDGPDPPSTQRTGVNTSSLPISAELIGYWSSYYPISHKKVIMAMKPASDWNLYTKDDFMTFPDSLWTETGDECNKVGVGFDAFRCAHDLVSPALAYVAKRVDASTCICVPG